MFSHILLTFALLQSFYCDVIDFKYENLSLLKQPGFETLLIFKAKWCSACKAFKPIYETLDKTFNENKAKQYKARIFVVDVDTEPALATQFFVTSIPKVYYIKEGIIRNYKGGRSEHELLEMFTQEKWEKEPPLNSIFGPFSRFGAALGCLVYGTHALKNKFQQISVIYIVFISLFVVVGMGYYILKPEKTANKNKAKKS